jgi:hypothetical protein
MNTHRVIIGVLSVVLGVAVSPKLAAVTYDLTGTPNVSINTIYGTAWFSTQFTKTTGTGSLNPFLSIQADGTEQGFNISQGDLDTKRNGQDTLTQHVSDLQYYAFLLDANESGGAATQISLDSLKIYTSSGSQAVLTSLAALGSSGTLRFDMDATVGGAGDVSLLYDDLNSGSGQGDLGIFIPVSDFAGALPTDYFYMYQQFSQTDGGFEETRQAGDITFNPIPETNAFLPLVAVLAVVIAGPVVRRYFPS